MMEIWPQRLQGREMWPQRWPPCTLDDAAALAARTGARTARGLSALTVVVSSARSLERRDHLSSI